MAAISALKDSGCDAPKGMKIVVSFVQDGDKKWNEKKNNHRMVVVMAMVERIKTTRLKTIES